MISRVPLRRLLKTLFGAAVLIVIAFASVSSFTRVKPLEAAAAGMDLDSDSIDRTVGCSAEVECPDGTRLSCTGGFGESCSTGFGGICPSGDEILILPSVTCGGIQQVCPCLVDPPPCDLKPMRCIEDADCGCSCPTGLRVKCFRGSEFAGTCRCL